jgi:hypothetical protein
LGAAVDASVFDRVEELLRTHGIAFQVLRHGPVYTSEEAARIRGTPLVGQAKADQSSILGDLAWSVQTAQ